MGICVHSGEELRETLQALAATAPSLKHVGYTQKGRYVTDVAIFVRDEDDTLLRWDTVALDQWKGRWKDREVSF